MGYGLAALAGLGRGSGGLLEGMMAGDKLALEQQQLAQQQQYQQGHLDLQRQQMLLPFLMQQQKAQQMAALAPKLTEALKPGMQTLTPGTTLETAPAPLAPRPATPMANIATPEDQWAKLARVLPLLAQYDPGAVTKSVTELAMPQKPIALNPTQRLVDVHGQPLGPQPPVPPPVTPPPGTRPVYSTNAMGQTTVRHEYLPENKQIVRREDIERQLRNEGLTPGTPAWDRRYLEYAQPVVVAPDVGAFSKPGALGPPPSNPKLINPNLPVGQQPVVQDAARELQTATGNLATEANRLPGAAPGAGARGGPQPSLPFPLKPEMATHYLNRNTWQPPPPGMTSSQIQASGEYVQVPTARINSLSQGRVVKGMLDELESIIVKRPDLFPVKATGGTVLDDALRLGKAKGYSMIPGAKDYDADLARLSSLSITLPSAVKAFGDTANIAVKEREIAEQATGLRPGMQDAALARVDLIRRMINDSIQTAGFPPFPSLRTGKAPAPAAMPGGSAPATEPQQAGQYVEGKRYRGSDGKMYRFRGGQMVPE